MKNTDELKNEFTIEKLPFSDIENYLRLPNGKSYSEIKEQAAQLSKECFILNREALKYVLKINGFPLIENYSDAIPKMIKFNFGIDIEDFGLLKINGKLDGFCFIGSDNNWQYITCSLSSKKAMVKRLMIWLIGAEKHKSKTKMFLDAVKKCINYIGHDFYTLPDNKSLDDVSNLYDINIDLEKLLYDGNGSGSDTSMRYALASCYNDYSTAQSLMNNALRNKVDYDDIKTVDLSDKYERDSLSDYVSRYQHFGAMLYNLDNENKEIVKELLDNYCGW